MVTSCTLKNDNIKEIKIITLTLWKMITSFTIENDNIQSFKNDNIYIIINNKNLYTPKLQHEK
jgi:hypothetical protein